MKSTKKHANAKHANAKKASKGPKTRLKRPFGDLPMVQVRMTNGGPQGVPPKSKKTPEQLDDEIAAALAGPPPLTSTVTILTVTHLFRHSSAPPHEQLFVFANRVRALVAMGVHLTKPEADTTINIRTLDIIR